MSNSSFISFISHTEAIKALYNGKTIQFSAGYSYYQLKRINHKLYLRFSQPHSNDFSPWQFTLTSPSNYLTSAYHIFILPDQPSTTPSPSSPSLHLASSRHHRKNKIKQLKKSLSLANAEITNLKKQLHHSISILHSITH